MARADEDALGELYDRFGRAAYGSRRESSVTPPSPRMPVQEAFLQVWRGAARYQPERGKASTWVLTFVHRRAVDLVRREERRRSEPATRFPSRQARVQTKP